MGAVEHQRKQLVNSPRHDKQLSHHTRSLANELLHQLRAGDSDERALGVVGNGTREQRLASARRTVQQHTLHTINNSNNNNNSDATIWWLVRDIAPLSPTLTLPYNVSVRYRYMRLSFLPTKNQTSSHFNFSFWLPVFSPADLHYIEVTHCLFSNLG